MRVWFTNLLVTTGAALLIAAIFLPLVCFFALVGGIFVGGCVSLWEVSPLFSSLMIFLVTTSAGMALWRRSDELSSALLTTGLFLAITSAAGIAVLLLQILVIHPFGLVAVAVSAGMIVVAAFIARQPGQSMRFQFHLRSLLLCVTMAALVLGVLRRVFE